MRNILIVYYHTQYPTLVSILDHLYSFRRHSKARCFYLNLAVQNIPRYFLKIPFDLIVFHTIFLSKRWHLPSFERGLKRARVLKNSAAIKVALPQDEFFNAEVVCKFINEFGVQHVFSVSPPSEWPKIYKTVDFQKVKFHHVLTGYLEDRTLKKIHRLARNKSNRNIDIGYRAWQAEPWLGRHGFLKTQLSEVFINKAPAKGLITDVSTRYEDTFLGDDWYKFLLRCKYTVGVEGGASLLDWSGKVRQKTHRYLSEHPNASFKEIEEECFPGQDGLLRLFAISPRHLEACATKTCQVLIEGEYNGLLTPGKNYIALKSNFSNLDQVLDIIKNDALREEIVENTYRDIVQSGRWSYKSFVQLVLELSLGGVKAREFSSAKTVEEYLFWQWSRLSDALSWKKIWFYLKIVVKMKKLYVLLPEPIKGIFLRWKRAS